MRMNDFAEVTRVFPEGVSKCDQHQTEIYIPVSGRDVVTSQIARHFGVSILFRRLPRVSYQNTILLLRH